MANVRFMFDNLIDAAGVVVTESSESSTLPSTNVINQLRTKVWRSGTSTALEWIVFDLGAAAAITSVILLDHDLTASDTLIKVQANATDSWGSPSFDQTLTWTDGLIAAYFASQSYRYIRITYTKSASGETRDIGRIFLGTYYEAVQNISPNGLTIQPVDLSKTGKSVGGQEYTDIRPIYDNISLDFNMMDDTQNEQFETIVDTVGAHTPLFISIDHDEKPVDWVYYARFVSLWAEKIAQSTPALYWAASMQLKEQL